MKTALLIIAGALVSLPHPALSADGPGPGPVQAIQVRLLDVEMESLVEAYRDVFSDMQRMRSGAIQLQIEAREGNADEIEREAGRIDRGLQLLERRLNELREEITGRAERLEGFRREQALQMEEREHRERELMGQARRQEMEQRERAEREMMAAREHERQARERAERERMQAREREPRFDNPDRRPRPDAPRVEKEVEVKVFVDGREVGRGPDEDRRPE